MTQRIVIVGAGPGGLASAMLLARAGAEVTVLERMPTVGGRTSTLQASVDGQSGDARDSFRFDLGPTFFLYPRVLEEIFTAVGRNLRDEVDLVRLDPQYHLVFGGGGDIRATPDVARMEQEIGILNPEDARHFRRFLDANRHKLAAFRPCLESAFTSWRDVFRLSMLKLMPILKPWLSLDGELARYFADPRLRLAFSFQSKYLGMSPFQCPSLFSILSFLEYEYGVFHPIGGCGAVSQAMARVARDLGVRIHLNEEVQEILFQGRKAVGVRTRPTGGGAEDHVAREYPADALVINADFAHAMTHLVPDSIRRRWTNRKLARKRYSCSTFMLYLGIEGRYDDLAHHTIYMARDYERNLREIEQGHVLSEDPSFYVQNACVTDPSLAPAGKSTLYVLVPVTHQHIRSPGKRRNGDPAQQELSVDWRKEAPRFRKLALRQLGRLGLDDVEERICYEHMVTPADWEHRYHIYRGATFNLAHTLQQMLHLRPNNRFEDLESVYLVGGGTHPGSGLPVIFESARITSRLLLQDAGLAHDHCLVPPGNPGREGVARVINRREAGSAQVTTNTEVGGDCGSDCQEPVRPSWPEVHPQSSLPVDPEPMKGCRR